MAGLATEGSLSADVNRTIEGSLSADGERVGGWPATAPQSRGTPEDPRTISSPRITATAPGGSSRPIAIRPARAPASASGSRTVVSDGTASTLNGRSSNPATDTSSGIRRPDSRSAAHAPSATESFAATTAVREGSRRRSSSVASCPDWRSYRPCTVQRGSSSTPAAASASRCPSSRCRVVVRSSGPAM